MNKILLPAQINPPSIRKDGSATIKFETRELTSEEYLALMGFRNTEGWLLYQPNELTDDIPDDNAELGIKTPSQRLRSVIFVLYKQMTEKGEFTGTFQTFYNEKMEKLIDFIKNKLD